MDKIIFWDFDGTLGYREGNWEETFFELTEGKTIKTKANYDLVSEMLKSGFPWHKPKQSFVFINNKRDWWEYVKPKFIKIFKALGYDTRESLVKAELVPRQYAKLEKWKLYTDSIPNLTLLKNHNWKNVLVTNNIPEFPLILKHLNLETFFDAVYVSALTGYNKPNPLILNGYLNTLRGGSKIIAVGDRVESDPIFAKAIKAESILVRTTERNQSLNFKNLTELTRYILTYNFE